MEILGTVGFEVVCIKWESAGLKFRGFGSKESAGVGLGIFGCIR